jgi:hypothetical protein
MGEPATGGGEPAMEGAMQFTLTIELGRTASYVGLYSAISDDLRQYFFNVAKGAAPKVGDSGEIVDEEGKVIGKWEVREAPQLTECGDCGKKYHEEDCI